MQDSPSGSRLFFPPDRFKQKSIKLLLEEFLDTQDEDEARQCVDDIDATGFQPHLVKAIIVMATEKKEVVREMLLQLITHFTKKSTITAPQFVAGYVFFFSFSFSTSRACSVFAAG